MGLIADIVKITEITQKKAAGLTKENKTFREILDEELKKIKEK